MWTNLSWVDVKTTDTCESITATSLRQDQREGRPPRLDEARVLHEISVKAREDGWPEQARRFARRALAILERDHADSREITKVLISLAAAYHDGGDYSRAETNYRRAFCLSRAMSEDGGRPEAQRLQIDSTRGLASVARALGNHGEAESLLKDSIAAAERTFGHQDPVVALVLNDLGVVYRKTGRFDNAHRLHRAALAVISKKLGAAHPQAADVLHNLAALKVAAGEGQRAEPFARRCLAIREQTFGPDHPRVGTEAAALASILEGLGRYDEAAVLYRRALSIFERWFGSDHHEVAATVNTLAGLVRAQDRAPAPLPSVLPADPGVSVVPRMASERAERAAQVRF